MAEPHKYQCTVCNHGFSIFAQREVEHRRLVEIIPEDYDFEPEYYTAIHDCCPNCDAIDHWKQFNREGEVVIHAISGSAMMITPAGNPFINHTEEE
jgi:hypothetical protein